MAWLVAIAALLFAGSVGMQAYAQKQHRQKAKSAASAKPDEYTRPTPSHKFQPTIPQANRYRSDKVFLEQADSLYRPAGSAEELQIVKGNVRFRQAGTWMYCDSAYYFPDRNSMDAFGHVRMQQGDTIEVLADKLFYDGASRFARLRCGPTRPEVTLENGDVTLTTDSLDYDLAADLGWYADGGQLEDAQNILVSQYGQYCPTTKDAEFFHDVELESKDGDFRMLSDTLYYNTGTNIARIETFTRIMGRTDTIHTSLGFYNTRTGVAEMLSRSLVTHTDSLNRVTTLLGDSIVYDPATRITRAYAFRDPAKLASPMVITDTARKATLIGGFGIYNDSTREAMATEYPLMLEYSRPDTLFLRADTIRTWLVERPLQPISADSLAMLDSLGIERPAPSQHPDSMLHVAKAYPRARFFRADLQGVADTIFFSEVDSLLRLLRLPIVWSEGRQVKGDTIIVHFNDSTADRVWLPHKGITMEEVEDGFFNQLSADKMRMYLSDGAMKRLEAEGSVMTIFLPQEKDSTYTRLVYAESSFMDIDMTDSGQAIDKLKMWPEVSGNVTPLFMVKKNQKLLPKARWLGVLRPRREWYGGAWHWADDLGELPEELERYFEEGL